MSNYEILHGPFDIETHKNHFYHYLEVVILDDGTVEYAVPSHQEKLLSISMKKLNLSREEVIRLCPKEYYLCFLDWLIIISGCVSVWEDFYRGSWNEAQRSKLQELKDAGLYLGNI